MIELKNIFSGYGAEQILEDICLTISQGKVTIIVGPNGCGNPFGLPQLFIFLLLGAVIPLSS